MQRFEDWRSRLLDTLQAAVHRPFRPGEHDCALFAADCVLAMTGHDLAAPFRGKYRTIKAGITATKKAGLIDHVGVAANALTEVHPAYAQVGDLAVLMDGTHAVLGVVQGAMIYVLKAEGLGLMPLTDAVRAFRV